MEHTQESIRPDEEFSADVKQRIQTLFNTNSSTTATVLMHSIHDPSHYLGRVGSGFRPKNPDNPSAKWEFYFTPVSRVVNTLPLDTGVLLTYPDNDKHWKFENDRIYLEDHGTDDTFVSDRNNIFQMERVDSVCYIKPYAASPTRYVIFNPSDTQFHLPTTISQSAPYTQWSVSNVQEDPL